MNRTRHSGRRATSPASRRACARAVRRWSRAGAARALQDGLPKVLERALEVGAFWRTSRSSALIAISRSPCPFTPTSPARAARLPLSFAAGDRNAFSGHPGGLVGGKKERHTRNVVGPAEPPHREREAHRFRRLGGDAERSQAFGLGRAGGDGVDPDAPTGEFKSERARDS